MSDSQIQEICNELINKNGFEESNVKFVLTGGEEESDQNNLYIMVTEFQGPDPSVYTQGVKVLTYEHERYFPEAKSTNYMTAMSLSKWQKREGAFEIMYTQGDKILEGTKSNFFLFKGDKLITTEKGILKGMTRNLVIDIATDIFEVEERDVDVKEIDEVTEAFLTSTNKDIVPIVKIQENEVGDGTVGSRTKKLMQAFKEFAERN